MAISQDSTDQLRRLSPLSDGKVWGWWQFRHISDTVQVCLTNRPERDRQV